MAFDTFVNGTTADADEVNAQFQTTVSNALTNTSFVAPTQHLNFTDDMFIKLDAVADTLLSTITGVTMVTTDRLIPAIAAIEVGYVVATAGTTAVSLQTNYIPAQSTVTQGTGKIDYIHCSQYGGIMDFTDATYWTITGVEVFPTYIQDLTTATSNDLADADRRITFLCGLEGQGADNALCSWVDDSGTNLIVAGVDPGVAHRDVYLVEIFLDTATTTVYIFINGIFQDKSTYDTTFKIKFDANDGNIGYCYCYCFSDGGATTTSITNYLTADGGSNWESATNGEGHAFTNTGTSLAFKSAYTLAANEFVIYRKGISMGGWY